MSASQWDPHGLEAFGTGTRFRAEAWWDPDLEQAPASAGGDIPISIDTAGAITIAGQSVVNTFGVPITEGAVTFAGQSVTSTEGVPIAAGAITIAGQSVTNTFGVPISNGTVTFNGQTVTSAVATVFQIDTAGAITIAGQSITWDMAAVISNGSLTIAGQSVTSTENVPVSNGVITFAGQAIANTFGAPISEGSVTFAGQTITFDITGALDIAIDVAGAIGITGQDIDFSLPSAVSSESVTGGGWRLFNAHYEQEMRRRRRKRQEEQEAEQEAREIQDRLDREIALLLREQEAKDAYKLDLERVRTLAETLSAQEAAQQYGERVAKALERAVRQSNYSALEALDREIQRAMAEEEWFLSAMMIILSDE